MYLRSVKIYDGYRAFKGIWFYLAKTIWSIELNFQKSHGGKNRGMFEDFFLHNIPFELFFLESTIIVQNGDACLSNVEYSRVVEFLEQSIGGIRV